MSEMGGDELMPAMVTHKGPSADSGGWLQSGLMLIAGHYIGWTRNEDSIAASGEEEWCKFDGERLHPLWRLIWTDDKVSVVTA